MSGRGLAVRRQRQDLQYLDDVCILNSSNNPVSVSYVRDDAIRVDADTSYRSLCTP
jgi:hypothetical protein